MNWYLKVVKEHYADFKGRARRREYWMFTLFNLIIMVVLTVIGILLRFPFIRDDLRTCRAGSRIGRVRASPS